MAGKRLPLFHTAEEALRVRDRMIRLRDAAEDHMHRAKAKYPRTDQSERMGRHFGMRAMDFRAMVEVAERVARMIA